MTTGLLRGGRTDNRPWGPRQSRCLHPGALHPRGSPVGVGAGEGAAAHLLPVYSEASRPQPLRGLELEGQPGACRARASPLQGTALPPTPPFPGAGRGRAPKALCAASTWPQSPKPHVMTRCSHDGNDVLQPKQFSSQAARLTRSPSPAKPARKQPGQDSYGATREMGRAGGNALTNVSEEGHGEY